MTPGPHDGFPHDPMSNSSAVEPPEFDLQTHQAYTPGAPFGVDDQYDQMGLATDFPNEASPWINDVFCFPNLIPSHFLDTNISLCDLFQQFPNQDQSAPQESFRPATELNEPTQQDNPQSIQQQDGSISQDLPLPPRMPSTGDQLHNSNLDAGFDTAGCPWILSSVAYKQISEKVTQNRSSLDGFRLPSKFTMVRYLEGYFLGFHDHLPFLHPATFDPQNIELELLLAMAAVGALYRFEHANGHKLYDAARCLTEQNSHNRRRRTMEAMMVGSPAYTEIRTNSGSLSRTSCGPPPETQGEMAASNLQVGGSHVSLQRAQTLIILMAMSAWGEQALVPDSLAMGSQLSVLVRELGISQPDDTTGLDLSWTDWVKHQQRRRTLLVAYIIFNLHSTFFHIPPLILSQEVALCLPSCEAEWKVSSSAGWHSYRQISRLREHAFTTTLNRLLQGKTVSDHGAISAFSNYVLIHGLVQKVYFEHQTATTIPPSQNNAPMCPPVLKTMETALRSWQSSWEATYESTLDPCSPKGPLGFNATALLRLAYIRLNANLGVCRDLASGNPTLIRKIFTDPNTLPLSRSASLDRAILQCIHALSIPVRVGIAYVARTQTLHWSIQHSICSLECAFLLTKWMQELAKVVKIDGLASLRGDEHKLLGMLTNLIQETHLADTLEHEEDHATRLSRLAASTARLWAEVTSGIHVFNMVHRIGVSLSDIADILETQIPPPAHSS